MSRGKIEDHGRFRRQFKRSASPESCSQLCKGVLIVFIMLNYYHNCYGNSLREKENPVKKRPKKIIISLAAINSYVMLSLKYVMQELSLNDIYYVSHWSFGKCKICIMQPVLKFGTFFFSPKILLPNILKLKKFALVRPGPIGKCEKNH